MTKQTKRNKTNRNKFSKKPRKNVKRRGGMDPPGRGRRSGRYSLNDFLREQEVQEQENQPSAPPLPHLEADVAMEEPDPNAMDTSDDPEDQLIIPLYGEDPLQIRHQYPGLVRLTRPIGDVYGPNKRQRSMRRNSGR